MEGYRADTYGEAFADVYDRWYGRISDPETTARFVERRAGPGPVLELGVGTGRLAGPLARRGRPVVGIDASRSMLRRCREATAGLGVALVRADMAALPLRGRFGAVLCAFNTLFNLAEAADQRRAVEQVGSLLGPQGCLVIEASTGRDLDAAPPSSVGVSRLTAGEVVLTATVVRAEDQYLAGQHVELSPAGIRLRPWQLRWITPEQLDELAAGAGLALAERHADWDGSPFDPATGERHVSVYRPAG
jgi:SAM-dependent methyltransferase